MDALRRIVRFLRVASRSAEATSGVSAAQLFVLQRLSESPASSLSELAGRTTTDPSSVSVVVSKLEARGLVARTASKEDKRRFSIALTAKGRAALGRAPELPQVRILDAVANLSAARRRALAQALSELVGAIGAAELPARMFFEDEGPRAPKERPAASRPQRARSSAPRTQRTPRTRSVKEAPRGKR